jgi:hypothetical protein
MESLSWNTPEFEEKTRHNDWVWTVGFVFALSSVVAFFFGNIFFGIFLVISGGILVFTASHKPKMLNITINESGVTINEETIEHDKINHFWIDEKGKTDKLLMTVSGSFLPVVSIPLNGVKSEDLRTVMLKYNKESEMAESIGIKIFERLGF